MPRRQILSFDIADRQFELRDNVAADDFVLMRRDTALPFPAGALAYCADLQAERVLYSLHGERLPELFAAPFLYAAQLHGATGVVSVPFELLDEVAGNEAPCPTLIFSPGRTGSTLLARLLHAAGAPCASEPDMLTQICRFEREERMRFGLPMEVALQRACLVSLGRALGQRAFIKLRSQCNARPMPILEAAPGASVVFMLRKRGTWARSRHRAFGEPPVSVAAVLRQAIDALDKLAGCGAPFRVVWFENLRRDPVSVLAGFTGAPVDPVAVTQAMAADAQEGTSVARVLLAGASVEEGFDAAFDAAWAAASEGAVWSETTLNYLAAMEELEG